MVLGFVFVLRSPYTTLLGLWLTVQVRWSGLILKILTIGSG